MTVELSFLFAYTNNFPLFLETGFSMCCPYTCVNNMLDLFICFKGNHVNIDLRIRFLSQLPDLKIDPHNICSEKTIKFIGHH